MCVGCFVLDVRGIFLAFGWLVASPFFLGEMLRPTFDDMGCFLGQGLDDSFLFIYLVLFEFSCDTGTTILYQRLLSVDVRLLSPPSGFA